MGDKSLDDLLVVSVTNTNMGYVRAIALELGQKTHPSNIMLPRTFTGGEFAPHFRLDKGVVLDKKTVYMVAANSPFKTAQEIMGRVCIAADAAKRNGAKRVVMVAPDLAYSRQDRGPEEDPKMEGMGIHSLVQARNLHANGVDAVIHSHLHNPKVFNMYANAYGVPNGREILHDFLVWSQGKRSS